MAKRKFGDGKNPQADRSISMNSQTKHGQKAIKNAKKQGGKKK